jgi:very-short-patch-repair endonuclease
VVNWIYRTTPLKEYYSKKNKAALTKWEEILWSALKSRKLGVTFVPQKVIIGYIVDFYCQKYKLAIEVDGETIHDPKSDRERDLHLNRVGVYVLRFTNVEVECALESVVKRIQKQLVISEGYYFARLARQKAYINRPYPARDRKRR